MPDSTETNMSVARAVALLSAVREKNAESAFDNALGVVLDQLAALEADQWRADAERWRIYTTSPQTALMLGSQLDPNDTDVDWKAECDRLIDERGRA